MSGPIEAQIGRIAGRAAARLAQGRLDAWRHERLSATARTVTPSRVADQLIEELPPAALTRLRGFLDSPDFEQLAMRLVLALAHPHRLPAEVRAGMRDELRESLRHATGLAGAELSAVTDVLFDALAVACTVVLADGRHDRRALDAEAVAAQGYLAALATRNLRLLTRIQDLAVIHEAADRLRRQVAALHAHLRLPHTGTSRSVPWDRLYVPPVLAPEPADSWQPTVELLAEPAQRTVVLGDPGAGKSTLATRLAYQVASGSDDRVPFLVVLREVPDGFGRGVVEQLTSVARDLYHVDISSDAVKYLLGNGRAVVVMDGLDELTDIGLRQRVVRAVEAFATRYPLVPILVTARRVGYLDAPLMTSLFRTAVIPPLDNEQVGRYATNWFALDDGTPEQDRERLRDAFLRESESIVDLRSNPLLLSLLCAMYATERFIPKNRAQIYERCAVMVFERWDSMRGVAMPLRFHGHVRGAVQELAWQMFSEREVSELPRHQVLRILVRFLEAKHFDPDEAQRLAEDFLAFCTGRAWILAEVGATDTEPLYGFAHRTFLEYFTAEHLVRRNPSPQGVWDVLAPVVGNGAWTVVAQLAVQLLDRNVDDGAEDLVALALDGLHDVEPAVAGFVAGVTALVSLSPPLIERITELSLACARLPPMEGRHRFFVRFQDPERVQLGRLDHPLWTVLYESLDANLPYVRRYLSAALDSALRTGSDSAWFVAESLGTMVERLDERRTAIWHELQGDLRARWPQAFTAVGPTGMWRAVRSLNIEDDWEVMSAFAEYGPAPFYHSVSYFDFLAYPNVVSILVAASDSGPFPVFPTAHLLRDLLLGRPTPWLPAGPWLDQLRPEVIEEWPWEFRQLLESSWPEDDDGISTFLVLCLPYLETVADHGQGRHIGPRRWIGWDLVRSRRGGTPVQGALPSRVAGFLGRWTRKEFSVVG